MRVVDAEREALRETDGVAESDDVTLGEIVGVPWHTQTPLSGAPQARRQQSCGQGVVEGEADTLADREGIVGVALGVTHTQVMAG